MLKLLIVTSVMLLTYPSAGPAADIAGVAWNESNIEVLRAFDESAVAGFVSRMRGEDPDPTPMKIGDFAWVKGAVGYRLVVTSDAGGCCGFDWVGIYSKGAEGKVRVQWIEGFHVPPLSEVIRDVDGDGKDELVVPSLVEGEAPSNDAWQPPAIWPRVYRWRGAQYVDASADSPAFYDKEVLPNLDKEIEEGRERAARAPSMPVAGDPNFIPHEAEARYPARKLAALEKTKDKILRVLGRPASAAGTAVRGAEHRRAGDPARSHAGSGITSRCHSRPGPEASFAGGTSPLLLPEAG